MPDYALSGHEGKVAIVTGAGRMRSIGRPIAVELAKAGCDVVITGSGRKPEDFPEEEKEAGWHDIESVADEVRAAGRRALPVISDVGDEHAVQELRERVVSEFGRVDFIVNNAALSRIGDRVPVARLPIQAWDRVIRVNLRGTFLMCHFFVQQMIAAGNGGAIINLSSVAGKTLPPNSAAYSASKAAIQAMSAGMAQEVGKYGIRVNVISPGIVDTHRLAIMHQTDAFQNAVSRIPMRRAGAGEDIAYGVVYLTSDQASWITGQNISIDGGQVVGR